MVGLNNEGSRLISLMELMVVDAGVRMQLQDPKMGDIEPLLLYGKLGDEQTYSIGKILWSLNNKDEAS